MNKLFAAFLHRSGLREVPRQVRTWFARMRSNDAKLIQHVETYNDFFFEDLNVSREEAEKEFSRVNAILNLNPGKRTSCHRFCFAALAVSGFKPKTILELGTSFGATTAFLSTIFPESTVYTFDLPPDDPLLEQFHPIDIRNNRNDLHKNRLDAKNIVQIQKNSIHLLGEDLPKFDLIWLDGGHFYPEVAWDHFYCMHRLNSGGWVFSDDIVRPEDCERGRAPDPWNVLEYFNSRFENKFKLLLKRENVIDHLLLPKYIGVLNKTK